MVVDSSAVLAILFNEPEFARHTGESLLFKGGDFPRTDVVPVL